MLRGLVANGRDATTSKHGDEMGNSKTRAVSQKHRQRQRAAKDKVRQHLAGKLEAGKLPELAGRYLIRHLRVAKRG
jgi:hypothetical protein